MSTLFSIKKGRKEGQCDAVRCTEAPLPDKLVTAMLWGVVGGSVKLCHRHFEAAQKWATENGFEVGDDAEGASEVVNPNAIVQEEAAKQLGWKEPNGLLVWLARAGAVLKELKELEVLGQKQEKDAAELDDVDDQVGLEMLAEFARETKTRLGEVVELEHEITRPIATALSRIRDACKPAKQAWADAAEMLRAQLEAAALRQDERNRDLMEQAHEAGAAGEDPTESLAKLTHVSDLPGVSLKLYWVAEVDDVDQMPDEWVIRIPNTKKLKEHCREAGAKEPSPVPGVTFKRDVSSRIWDKKT